MSDLTISEIIRENPVTPKNAIYIKEQVEYDWVIETTNGEISFKSTGYDQFVRQKPVLSNVQQIGLLERGGISFNTFPYNGGL